MSPHHLRDWHYWSRSGFSWPTPPPPSSTAEAAVFAADEAAARVSHGHGGPPRYPHYHGYGYHYRPRFGLFRRMFWFGLGVGVANWYIHRNDQWNQSGRCISERGPTSSKPQVQVDDNEKYKVMNRDWRSNRQQPTPAPTPALAIPHPVSAHHNIKPESKVLASLPMIEHVDKPEEPPKRGWGARREERRRRREAAMSEDSLKAREGGNEEIDKIREAVDKIWAERKQAAVEIQATANEKAKEYARVKLESLSQAVDTLRDALKADAEKAAQPTKLV